MWSATGDPDAQHPCCSSGPRIHRLTVGRYAPADVCSGSVSPHVFYGGHNWPVCLSGGREIRGVSCSSPSAPSLGNGEKAKKRVRGFRVASVGRCKASPRLCRSAPPAPLVLDTALIHRRSDTSRKRVPKHSSGAPDPVRIQSAPAAIDRLR